MKLNKCLFSAVGANLSGILKAIMIINCSLNNLLVKAGNEVLAVVEKMERNNSSVEAGRNSCDGGEVEGQAGVKKSR